MLPGLLAFALQIHQHRLGYLWPFAQQQSDCQLAGINEDWHEISALPRGPATRWVESFHGVAAHDHGAVSPAISPLS